MCVDWDNTCCVPELRRLIDAHIVLCLHGGFSRCVLLMNLKGVLLRQVSLSKRIGCHRINVWFNGRSIRIIRGRNRHVSPCYDDMPFYREELYLQKGNSVFLVSSSIRMEFLSVICIGLIEYIASTIALYTKPLGDVPRSNGVDRNLRLDLNKDLIDLQWLVNRIRRVAHLSDPLALVRFSFGKSFLLHDPSHF